VQLRVSKYILALLFVNSSIYSDEILSQKQLKNLQLSQDKANIDSSKLKIDWLNPINFSYKENISIPKKDINNFIIPNTKISTISINQPIFKSGGIYNAIKYANSNQKYQTLDIKSKKKALIKDATLLLFQLKQLDLKIKKQLLKIKNSKIDVDIKNKQVLNNLLDMAFLNNAIITLNKDKIALEDLYLTKYNLINKFNNLSSLSYNDIQLPKLTLINQNEFIQQNIYIKKAKENETSLRYVKNMTISKYLPTVSITHDYLQYHDRDIVTNTTGVQVRLALDARSYYDTQSAKISYLKSKNETSLIILKEQNLLKSLTQSIKSIDNKLKIQHSTLEYFSKLINQTTELYDNGLKTKDDLIILQNSKNIEMLNLEIFNFDKQIKLWEIYARTN